MSGLLLVRWFQVRRMAVRWAAAFLAVCCAAAVSGCEVDQREPADGSLVIYSGRSAAVMRPIINEFEHLTGIKVTIRYGESADLARDIVKSGSNSPADIFLSDETASLVTLSKHGALSELPPQVRDKAPPSYRGPSNDWVGITGRVAVVVYNSTMVSEAEVPTGLEQLSTERWRGKVAIASGSNAMKGMVAGLWSTRGSAEASATLKLLADNNPVVAKNDQAVIADVMAGRAALGVVQQSSWLRNRQMDDLLRPSVGARYFARGDAGGAPNICGEAILKKAKGDKDARHFAGLLLSVEKQRYFADRKREHPLAREARTPAYFPALQELGVAHIDSAKLPDIDELSEAMRASGLPGPT